MLSCTFACTLLSQANSGVLIEAKPPGWLVRLEVSQMVWRYPQLEFRSLNDFRIVSTRFSSRRDQRRSRRVGNKGLVRPLLETSGNAVSKLLKNWRVVPFEGPSGTQYRRSKSSTHFLRIDSISRARCSICSWISGSNCSNKVLPPYTYTRGESGYIYYEIEI